MKSETSKIIFTVLLTAVIVGVGSFLLQNRAMNTFAPTAQKNLFEMAKSTDNEFTYLVTAQKIGSDYKMTINNNFEDFKIKFALSYPFAAPWGALRYATTDLTATDGNPGPNGLAGFVGYTFCAERYYCDEQQRKGMGFDLTFWNAKYTGRSAEPNFHLQNGEKLLKETPEYIVTYKPFEHDKFAKVDEEVSNLLKTFELY